MAAPMKPAELQRLYNYWLAIRGHNKLPHRRELNPAAISFCLAHVGLAEIERNPFRVRYRLVGTRLVELYGEDLTGRYVDQAYTPSIRQEALDAYRRVVLDEEPLYSERVIDIIVRKFGYYRLMLPFSWKTANVDLVLVAIYMADGRIQRAEDWRNLAEVQAFLAEIE
jgi:hypothetical protein